MAFKLDFEQIYRNLTADWTPEQHAKAAAYEEAERRFDLTRETLAATIVRYSFDQKTRSLTEVSRTSRLVDVRIEQRDDWRGNSRDVLRFIGGSTGHESFELNSDFVAALLDTRNGDDSDDFWPCGGGAKYDGVLLSKSRVLDYIAEHRPDLYQPASPKPRPASAFSI